MIAPLASLASLLALSSVLPVAAESEAKRETPIFSRAQFKYGLGRTDYLSRWVDRPLMVDPTLADPNNHSDARVAPAAFLKTQETVLQYGLRGLAFFPEVTNDPQGVYAQLAERRVEGFQILTDFTSEKNDARKIAIAGQALANPASFRLDGKVVIISYLASQHPPEYWRGLLDQIRAAHGDHFLFFPALDHFAGKTSTYWIPAYHAGRITQKEREAVRENLREWLRATDGLYVASAASYKRDFEFDADFYRGFIIQNFRDVLAEPEFAGRKRLALSAAMGHENCTRFGYTLNSGGTQTLRQSLEAALEAEPDLVVIPEWDEQNENTSLRPTIYNGHAPMRLLRHYTAQERGELQEPLAGDDLSIPNLVVSYRKIVTLGEPLTVELLFIPERGVAAPTKVQIGLENENGVFAYLSEELTVEPGQLWTHRIVIPSETLASHHTLRPEVRITQGEEIRKFNDGLHSIDLRPSWNWDYKWTLQPLRELFVPHARLSIIRPTPPEDGWLDKLQRLWRKKATPDETLKLSVDLETTEPLAYVEVLDNDDVIYSHAPQQAIPRESASEAVFRIGWQSLEWRSFGRKLSGSLTLKGASGTWQVPAGIQADGLRVKLDGALSSIWEERLFLTIPRSAVDQAVLQVDLPGIWSGEVPLQTVFRNGGFGIPGPVGFNLVATRYLRQNSIPEHLNTTEVQFTIPLAPDLPRSRVQVQAITKSGRIYRSKPFLMGAPEGRLLPLMVYSEAQKAPVQIAVDASRLPDLVYRFAPEATGSLLMTSAGRPFYGILGGYSSQATGRGGAESRDGTPFLKPGDYPALITQSLPADYASDTPSPSQRSDVRSAPEWHALPEGGHSLLFNGESTFITLPQGAIPRRAGYELAMELKPAHLTGSQILLANRSFYPGSITLLSQEGEVIVRFLNQQAKELNVRSGLKLRAGAWNRLAIRYDQGAISFTLDDQQSGPFPLPGPGIYETVTTIGGYGTEWYAGELKSLRIRHGGAASR